MEKYSENFKTLYAVSCYCGYYCNIIENNVNIYIMFIYIQYLKLSESIFIYVLIYGNISVYIHT